MKFPDSDMHRVHFKSDWHRYNLKRKVADLSVVTLAVFETRKEAHEKLGKDGEKEVDKTSSYCIACGKNFKNTKAYNNHIQSKKHQEMILKFEVRPAKVAKLDEEVEEKKEEMDVEEVDSDEWEDDEPVPVGDCLFCSHHSSSLDKSLTHMTVEHSFFLPDPEFLTNVEGLIEYLGAKVLTRGQGTNWHTMLRIGRILAYCQKESRKKEQFPRDTWAKQGFV